MLLVAALRPHRHKLFDLQRLVDAAGKRPKKEVANRHDPASHRKEPRKEKGERIKIDKIKGETKHRAAQNADDQSPAMQHSGNQTGEAHRQR